MKLGELINVKTGKLDANAENMNGQYPFFTCSKQISRIDSYAFDCECVLIAGNGELYAKYYNGKFNAYQRTYVIESNDKNRLDVKFLFYFFTWYIEILRHQSIGGVIKYIKLTNLVDVDIKLPTLEKQKQIVNVLENLQSCLSNKEKEINNLDNLIKSRFIEMFGDPIDNPYGWALKPLLSLGECKNGMNFRNNEQGVDIHCLGVGDFKNLSIIDDVAQLPIVSLNCMPSSEYLLKDGDIVFVRSNGNKALVGRSIAIYPKETSTTFSGFCIRFRKKSDAVNTYYLLQVFKSDSTRRKMAGRGANIQNLNQQILASLNIPIPPIELQNDYETFVKLIDKSKFVYHSKYFLWLIFTFVSSTIAYSNVVSIFECPNRCCTCSIGIPLSMALVASVLLNLCG